MKTWLLLLLAAVFGGVRSQRACEQYWVGFEDSCYYASPYSEASVSWHSARAWCVANGGDLTSIFTEEEQNFVMTLALSVDYVDFMWIGLNQLSDRVTLEWSDGTPVNYSNWLPTYPHNDQLHLCTYIKSAVTFKAPYTEASRKLSSAQVATWLTDNCGVEAGFVCKKPQNSTVGAPTPTPVVPGYCPTGYSGTGNKCFKVFRPVEGQLVTWPDALAICRAQPGRLPDLASITSEEEQNIIIAQLRDIEAGMWIGMHVWYDDYSKDWLWVDNSEKSYENWESSEPIYDEEAQCAEMATWEAGLWNNAPCSALRGYVCQTYKDENAVISTPQPTPFPCPDGYVAYWYACYKFVDTLVSWDVANQTCVSEGAQLVSIHSEPENSAIFTYAGNRLPKWIGFRQNAVSGDFVWTDGWAEHYTNWAYAEPYDGQCAIISREETWEAVPCVGTFGYICKIPEVTPTSPPYVEGSCPTANWVPWGSHCYYFTTYNEDVTTWNSAQAICTALAGRNFNGSVASITSEAENRFIYNSIVETGWTYSDAWIGLKQTSVGQPYYWVDGSPLTYTRWAAEEPSASPDTQCGMMHMADWPGHWYDQPCTENSYVQTVCKTPKGPVQT